MSAGPPSGDIVTALGIAGIGSWGRNLVRVFDELADVRRCCHTGNPASTAWLETEYPEIERTTDFERLLDDDTDAVVIATPIDTLADLTERAVAAGKDVYVEKPMAATPAEAHAIADAAAEQDVLVFVGYIFVHHPLFRRLRGNVDRAGIEQVRFEWHTLGTFGPELVNNLACHPLSVAIDWFGPPDTVSRVESFPGDTDPDVLGLELTYEGARCTVRLDRLSPEKSYRLRCYTQEGGCHVATDDSYAVFDRHEERFEEDNEMAVDPLTTECQRFLRARRGETAPITTATFGASVADVLKRVRDVATCE